MNFNFQFEPSAAQDQIAQFTIKFSQLSLEDQETLNDPEEENHVIWSGLSLEQMQAVAKGRRDYQSMMATPESEWADAFPPGKADYPIGLVD
jgi:hypothetical protein